MQENSLILYKAISKVIDSTRKNKNIRYTDFCYENDIPMSTYDAIINVTYQSTYYNIAKVIKALGLTFEEFGKMLDDELPENFMNNEE